MSALPHPDDTIAALASAVGPGERGIVRVSGRGVIRCLRGWFVPRAPIVGSCGDDAEIDLVFHDRITRCTSGRLTVARLTSPLPVDLFLWPGVRSYTGEPLAELHTVGSPPLLEALLADLFARGVRPAQPGEFTLRAFLAGRIDLMQAEAVLGVIDARDQNELHVALEQLGGGVSSQVVRLRGDLLDLLADLEAGLDFSEEEIEFVSHAITLGRIGLARDAVVELLRRAGGRLRSAAQPRVVLAGLPNAGKSSLFNALVGSDAALVSDERGTTRDYLTAEVKVQGVSFTLIDTAGCESAPDPISDVAQAQRLEQLRCADLVVWCHAVDRLSDPAILFPASLRDDENVVVAITKSDLATIPAAPIPLFAAGTAQPVVVSAHTRLGLDSLKSTIVAWLVEDRRGRDALLGSTAARCEASLQGALQALDRALEVARTEIDDELLAVDLRDALDEMGKIVGAVYTDDILGRIFSKFCIGK